MKVDTRKSFALLIVWLLLSVGLVGRASTLKITDVGVLPNAAISTGNAFAINDAGQIVGDFDPVDNGKAFLYDTAGSHTLGTLGGTFSHALAINASGQVVGQANTVNGKQHAFVWQNGQMTDLGTLGGTFSQATAINASGQVVGWATTTNDAQTRAFLWQGGQMIDLGTLGGSNSRALAINASGQVVGWSTTAKDASYHAFVWQNGQMTDLGTLGGTYSQATAINANGQVVGWANIANGQYHAFVWQNGQMTNLGTLGGSNSHALAINANGQVIGQANTTNDAQTHAFVWQNGQMADLGTLGGTFSQAIAINANGQVVGFASITNDTQTHAFLWQNGQMADLGTLGGTFSQATAINASGQVVGQASTANGQRRAFVWQNGQMTSLNSVPYTYSTPAAISASGSIAGNAATVSNSLHAFVWQGGQMTDLGTLGGTFSQATAINASGQVVGYAYTDNDASYHAFLWQNGQIFDLGTLGGTFSQATAINANGQIIGQASTVGDAFYHAFVWQNGQMIDLGTLGGSNSFAIAINANGQVVGQANTANDVSYDAFLWQNGQMTDLGTLGGTFSQATAINANGQVVGYAYTDNDASYHAFLWQNGQIFDLGTLGGTFSQATAINANGQVVGWATTANDTEQHAFLWQNGQMTDLGTLGGTFSQATAINANGQVVGWATTANEAQTRTFLWQNGQITDIGDLFPLNSGWMAPSVPLINDNGQIAGQAVNPSQNIHAFLLADNQRPVANDQALSLDQDTSATVTLTGSDPDNDPLTYVVTVQPEHGTLSGSVPNLTYTPEAGYVGADSVKFKVNDGQADSNEATISLTINHVNHAPSAQDDTAGTTANQAVTINVLTNDSDPDGDTLNVQNLTQPAHGSAALNSDGTVTYTPNADYVGDDSFTYTATDGALASSAATVSVTIIKQDTVLTVANANGTFGQTVTFSATLTAHNAPVGGKTLVFKLAGNVVGNGTTDAGGTAQVSYLIPENLGVGDQTITAEFAGDSTNNPSQGSGTLTVTKGDTTVTVGDATGSPGQTITLLGMLKRTSDGTVLSGKTLVFSIDGTQLGTATTDANGTAQVSYSIPESLGIGSHQSTVTFAGDSSYNSSSGTGTLTVTKGDTSIAVGNVTGAPGQTVTLSGVLTRSSDGAALSGKTLVFKVDGTQIGTGTTDTNGTATVSYKIPDSLSPGDHQITVEFAGDSSYNASSGTGTLTITKADTTVTVSDATGTPGQTVTLTGVLTRTSDNAGLSGKTLVFKVDGTQVGTGNTNSSGTATVSYKIPDNMSAGNHQITVEFAGDNSYNSSSGTGTLTVTKADTTVTAGNATGSPGQTVTLTGVLTRTSDGAGLSGKTLTFKIDGTQVGTATTLSSGTASFKYKIPDGMSVGNHQITVTFAGDSSYNASSGTGTLTVTKADTTVTADNNGQQYAGSPGQTITLRAVIKRTSDGAGLSGKTLVFKVDGTQVGTAVSVGGGSAWISYKIPDNMSAGNHQVTVEFGGDASYNASSGTGTLTVMKADTSITVGNVTGAPGQTVTLTGVLKRTSDGAGLSGKTLVFKIDGTQVGTATTVSGGTASFKYKLPDTLSTGSHQITVTFAGDSSYNASSGTGTLTITKADTTVTAGNATGSPGQTVTLTGVLKRTSDGAGLSGKTLVFKIDGTQVGTATTVSGGTASFKYKLPDTLSTGSHQITVTFAGDSSYNASSGTGTLTMTKADTSIAANNGGQQFVGSRNQTITLRAVITRTSDGTGLSGKTLVFKIDGATVGTTTSVGGGSAWISYKIPANMTTGSHSFTVTFAGDASYNPSSGSGTLTVN